MSKYSHRTVKELKTFIKKYNDHFKIMVTGKKKADLIKEIEDGMKKTVSDELKKEHEKLIFKVPKEAKVPLPKTETPKKPDEAPKRKGRKPKPSEPVKTSEMVKKPSALPPRKSGKNTPKPKVEALKVVKGKKKSIDLEPTKKLKTIKVKIEEPKKKPKEPKGEKVKKAVEKIEKKEEPKKKTKLEIAKEKQEEARKINEKLKKERDEKEKKESKIRSILNQYTQKQIDPFFNQLLKKRLKKGSLELEREIKKIVDKMISDKGGDPSIRIIDKDRFEDAFKKRYNKEAKEEPKKEEPKKAEPEAKNQKKIMSALNSINNDINEISQLIRSNPKFNIDKATLTEKQVFKNSMFDNLNDLESAIKDFDNQTFFLQNKEIKNKMDDIKDKMPFIKDQIKKTKKK